MGPAMGPATRGSPPPPAASEQRRRLPRGNPAGAGPPAGEPRQGGWTTAGPSGRDRMAVSGGARSWMCCAGNVLARRHDIRQGPVPDHEPGCRAEAPPDARACAGSRLQARTEGPSSPCPGGRRDGRRAIPRARHPRPTPRTRAASAGARPGGRTATPERRHGPDLRQRIHDVGQGDRSPLMSASDRPAGAPADTGTSAGRRPERRGAPGVALECPEAPPPGSPGAPSAR